MNINHIIADPEFSFQPPIYTPLRTRNINTWEAQHITGAYSSLQHNNHQTPFSPCFTKLIDTADQISPVSLDDAIEDIFMHSSRKDRNAGIFPVNQPFFTKCAMHSCKHLSFVAPRDQTRDADSCQTSCHASTSGFQTRSR